MLNHGRDATCPAGKREGPVQEMSARVMHRMPDNGPGPRGRAAMRQVTGTKGAIHAGILFLAGIRPCLPVRLVKRIDRFALKILKDRIRRYCL